MLKTLKLTLFASLCTFTKIDRNRDTCLVPPMIQRLFPTSSATPPSHIPLFPHHSCFSVPFSRMYYPIGLDYIKTHLKEQSSAAKSSDSLSSEEDFFSAIKRTDQWDGNTKLLESYLASPTDSIDTPENISICATCIFSSTHHDLPQLPVRGFSAQQESFFDPRGRSCAFFVL